MRLVFSVGLRRKHLIAMFFHFLTCSLGPQTEYYLVLIVSDCFFSKKNHHSLACFRKMHFLAYSWFSRFSSVGMLTNLRSFEYEQWNLKNPLHPRFMAWSEMNPWNHPIPAFPKIFPISRLSSSGSVVTLHTKVWPTNWLLLNGFVFLYYS